MILLNPLVWIGLYCHGGMFPFSNIVMYVSRDAPSTISRARPCQRGDASLLVWLGRMATKQSLEGGSFKFRRECLSRGKVI
jgi:hypothetical protein